MISDIITVIVLICISISILFMIFIKYIKQNLEKIYLKIDNLVI